MNIDTRYNFHKLLSINMRHQARNLTTIIPKEWLLILVNDGSFTETLTYLTGKKISIEIVKQHSLKKICTTREIWLQNNKNVKLAFAKSFLPLSKVIELYNNKPIGQSLIEHKTDIYKDIHEIYYGYCQYLENRFDCKGPLWGRKYTIYYNETRLVTLQEIFAPKIINFLKQ
uniref:Conserved hypothetical plastid protein n=1 Tax=Caulacanthus okamurae TaxID=152008 RepID=A0A6H1U9M0_9FLOR|nr:conserved hypothetical plastid protein [Caulacanthus okamurae]QIZ74753.1 conserved hypothetical plastid protein [Caulacanthus okamurae]